MQLPIPDTLLSQTLLVRFILPVKILQGALESKCLNSLSYFFKNLFPEDFIHVHDVFWSYFTPSSSSLVLPTSSFQLHFPFLLNDPLNPVSASRHSVSVKPFFRAESRINDHSLKKNWLFLH